MSLFVKYQFQFVDELSITCKSCRQYNYAHIHTELKYLMCLIRLKLKKYLSIKTITSFSVTTKTTHSKPAIKYRILNPTH